jgi:hypothetical protein
MSAWNNHKTKHIGFSTDSEGKQQPNYMKDGCYYCDDAIESGSPSRNVIVEAPLSNRKLKRLLLSKGVIRPKAPSSTIEVESVSEAAMKELK